MTNPAKKAAEELATELVGNVQFYETQERWGCMDIAKGWPDVIPAPHTPHGRLKKVLTVSLVERLSAALRAARALGLEEAAKVVDNYDCHFHHMKTRCAMCELAKSLRHLRDGEKGEEK